jgi:hypothetical protein
MRAFIRELPLWPMFAGPLALVALCLGFLAYDGMMDRAADSCRVQVLTSEERIRDAVAVANRAYGDKIAVLIRELRVAP